MCHLSVHLSLGIKIAKIVSAKLILYEVIHEAQLICYIYLGEINEPLNLLSKEQDAPLVIESWLVEKALLN
jgi:hypothetical protein